ncbi:hypothetical protein [Sorangium sp. So ce854]|uniref:hypothetical protein n=1 Tax=Sorangium sp. So ce854 TaxID=3133322 RepID=UPI003F606E57
MAVRPCLSGGAATRHPSHPEELWRVRVDLGGARSPTRRPRPRRRDCRPRPARPRARPDHRRARRAGGDLPRRREPRPRVGHTLPRPRPGRDGALCLRAEARAAAGQGARALGQAAFQAADGDRSGALSVEESQDALQGTAQSAFRLADSSNDGELSRDEAAVALGQLTSRLGIQSPARAQ